VKVSCPVWRRGKGRDYLKALPIPIVRNGHHSHFDGAPHFADEESDLYRRDTRKKACDSGRAEACAVSGDPLRQKGQTEHLPCRTDLKVQSGIQTKGSAAGRDRAEIEKSRLS